MADEEQLAILNQGAEIWNKWRRKHPEVTILLILLANPLFVLVLFQNHAQQVLVQGVRQQYHYSGQNRF